MTGIAAVILAGGEAQRLGGINKALLDVDGRPLVERARDAATGCDPVLLAVGRRDFAVAGMQSIPDLAADYGGPLAGVVAAVDWLRGSSAELLLTLAVDTPFFPADFLGRALGLLGDADGVMAGFGAQDYPTNALWRLSALAELPDALRAGTAPHSLKRFALARRVVRLDYENLLTDDPFANVNTPDDLAILRARNDR